MAPPLKQCDFPPLTAIFFLLLTQPYGSFKKLQLIQKKSDEIFLASELLRSSRGTVLTRKKPIFTVCRALESFFMFSTHTVLSLAFGHCKVKYSLLCVRVHQHPVEYEYKVVLRSTKKAAGKLNLDRGISSSKWQ